jgi:UDP-GlcNAc:undecaprenyl-phosphate GlcNAc-1-phosphate transferase
VLIIVAALGTSIGVCFNADAIGRWLDVMDHPDAQRKHHAMSTPQVGGIALILPLLIWAIGRYFWAPVDDTLLMQATILCAAGVGLIGFADDQSSTTPLSRVCSLLVFLGVAFVVDPALIARSLNWGSFDATAISPWLYYILMAITSVGLVNAVNMADGQNGIVAGMFAVWGVSLALVSGGTIAVIAEMLLVLSLIVLCFNLLGKLFLGDCGTYGVTFVFGLLTAAAHAKGYVSLETIVVWFFIPVMDCLRLLISRLLSGRSPALGDRDHFHHRLEDKMGRDLGLITYVGAVGISSLTATLEPKFALVCLTGLAAFYSSFAWLTDSASVRAARPAGDVSGKIVSLTNESAAERKRRGKD